MGLSPSTATHELIEYRFVDLSAEYKETEMPNAMRKAYNCLKKP